MMKIKLMLVVLFGVLIVAGCTPGGGTTDEEVPQDTSSSGGSSEQIRGRATLGMDEPNMIARFFVARLMEYGTDQSRDEAVEVAKDTNDNIGQSNGLTNTFDFRISADNVDPGKNYFVKAQLFDSAEEKVLLYNGECETKDCAVLTFDNPNRVNVTLIQATDIAVIVENAVPLEYREKCNLVADTSDCETASRGVYFDTSTKNCRRASVYCGEEPLFEDVWTCQTACYFLRR